jgi:hypothetical protein
MGMRKQFALPGYILAGVAAFAVGCGDGGSEGSTGIGGNSTGATSPSTTGGTGGASPGFQCTPGAYFCDGDTAWQCNRSGTDASEGTDCTYIYGPGTTCSTTNCLHWPSGNPVGACCLLADGGVA